MNGKQLKNSILQWAIQGKLVPQDPNDEPASVLLERIRVEKAKFVKKKKIKKDKNESIIYRGDDNSYYEKFLATGEVKCIDEEIPFEIPATWEWVRLSNVSVIQEGPGIRSFQYMPSGIQLLTVTNILEGKVDMKKQTKFISEQEYNDKYTHFTLKQGDIVCACSGGSWGKSALFNVKGTPVILNTSTLRLRYFSDLGCNLYLYHITKSSFFKNQLAEQLSGMQPNFGYTHYSKVLLPLPPLREQKRISKLIEQILPYIFKYNSAQEILNNLNNDISIKLKKSILQEAIQGKLVPQIAEEGTAQELLEQIKFEKQKLVKESKLKKSALADSIIYKGDDNKYYERINEQIVEIELPFEYPNSWVVLRLKDICQLTDEKREPEGHLFGCKIPAWEIICSRY
ncbi:MAG: restriction endonuclease subunit S [Odoribacter splanchnicus]